MSVEGGVSVSDVDALIDAARRGSQQAFSHIVRLYQARVRTYLDRLLSHKDLDIVDDLAQQTFLDAYRALASYEGGSPFDFWLLRIAKNRALKFLRDDARRQVHEGQAVDSIVSRVIAERVGGDDGDLSEQEQRVAALRLCLQSLPPRSADLIAEYYFRARQGVDIARDWGMKESTVWVTILRIRDVLRSCIERRLDAAPGAP